MERGTLLLFIVGFFLLLKGADMLVNGASSLAKRFKISDMIIGLTIVAFWTSSPELVVNITSSLQWITGITVGNILGSNIANILLILWISAVIYPIAVKKEFLSRELILSIMATVVFAVFINDRRIDGAASSIVTRSEGLLLIILLWFFLYYVSATIKVRKTDPEQEVQLFPLWKSVLWIVLWLIGLILGWEWIVNWAVMITKSLGISERIIWLTIVAVWTSLPELATSAIAAYKGKSDIALGNVIWSNIFNILFILGVSALITPIPAIWGTNADLLILVIATALVLVFWYGVIGKKWQIGKREGGFMILLYIGYLTYLVMESL